MKTHLCTLCRRNHALFYWIGKSGKKVLSYICNRVPKLDSYGNATSTTARMECGDNAQGLDIPEEWGAGWAKKKRFEQELQLPLTRKPNENTQIKQ